nr:hypothetical protein [Psychrobacter sp.]
MSETSANTIKVNMVKGGKSYGLVPRRMKRIEDVFAYAKETMTSPCAFHLITHIHDAEMFGTTKSKGFIKEFKRALKRQYKPATTRKTKSGRRQQCPNTIVIYSIEYKLTSQKEIDGDNDTYKYGYEKTDKKLPFLHIHTYVIADCDNTIPENLTYHAMNAMNELDGLKATRYAPTKDKDPDKDKKKYKKLNTDYDDAVLRAFYLAKVEQKSSEIPYRKAFDASKIS